MKRKNAMIQLMGDLSTVTVIRITPLRVSFLWFPEQTITEVKLALLNYITFMFHNGTAVQCYTGGRFENQIHALNSEQYQRGQDLTVNGSTI